MKHVRMFFGSAAGLLAAFAFPLLASAHEVYVLTSPEVAEGLTTPAFSPWSVIAANPTQFLFWAGVGAILVFCIFFISTSRFLERLCAPTLIRLKPYAPMVARITIGLSFLAAAYYQALFGPEIPLSVLFGSAAPLVTIILLLVGVLLCINRFGKIAALVALCFFAAAAWRFGWYMLTYTNYFGELLIVAWLGIENRYSPLVLRFAFGTSMLYASLYAKFLHNDLALQVASLPLAGHSGSLAAALGFEPHFLVLGAGIVELVIGTFFLLGIEIRFTALFLEFWLTLSLLYFGEVVWPHIVLIGIPIALFLHGYDHYSLEGYFFKKRGREPVL